MHAPEEPKALVVHSHGLGGHASIYSYQTLSLASHGHVVAVLTHQDGSAALVEKADGSVQGHDFEILELWNKGEEVAYARERRNRNQLRVQELVAVTKALHKWHDGVLEDVEHKDLLHRRLRQTGAVSWLELEMESHNQP